jgi:hypothetical protein
MSHPAKNQSLPPPQHRLNIVTRGRGTLRPCNSGRDIKSNFQQPPANIQEGTASNPISSSQLPASITGWSG